MSRRLLRSLCGMASRSVMPLNAAGCWRENIAHDGDDRELLVATLAEACQKAGWQVLAWVLVDHRSHGLIRTPEPNLVGRMQGLQSACTRRLKARQKAEGRRQKAEGTRHEAQGTRHKAQGRRQKAQGGRQEFRNACARRQAPGACVWETLQRHGARGK